MSWLENFSKAIEYIETHLDKEISYEDMAKITGCSTFLHIPQELRIRSRGTERCSASN